MTQCGHPAIAEPSMVLEGPVPGWRRLVLPHAMGTGVSSDSGPSAAIAGSMKSSTLGDDPGLLRRARCAATATGFSRAAGWPWQ
jgi:hypothetical protein